MTHIGGSPRCGGMEITNKYMNQREIKFREHIEYQAEDKDGFIWNVYTKRPIHKDSKGWYWRQGYIIRLVGNHPYADKRGYVQEHRLIMEKSIGRILEPTEIIHHRDQNRANNELSNLELRGNQGEHAKENLRGKRNPHGEFVAQEPIFSEIKFRLFNKNTKTTRIYNLATLIGTTFRRGQFEFRGRWTGLKDKNGKEIYEGDIVSENGEGRYEVEWQDGLWTISCYGGRPWHELGVIEVIGNIYENSELLKQ